MNIIINHSSAVPIYEQLINHIKYEIASGQLHPGECLPSVRTLATQLQISALTVKKAYDRLEEEQVLVTVHGKGSFVNENSSLIEENRRREAENVLAEAVERSRSAGFSNDEIRQLIELILEEN